MTVEQQWLADLGGAGDGTVRSRVSVRYPLWKTYGSRLDWMELFSPNVRVRFRRDPAWREGQRRTDIFGCEWHYPIEDLSGQVKTHPLANWSALDSYVPPDPDDWLAWSQVEKQFAREKAEGIPCAAGVEHGFVFLRLTYLRGFEQFMLDTVERPPELEQLIGIIETYWTAVVQRYIDIGVEIVTFADDLGLQDRLPISPDAWRELIAPTYERLFGLCRRNGVRVFLHTDGYIVPILDDLVRLGVDILNPQDFVNGLDTLAGTVRGRISIDLDIDRQFTTVRGTPEEIDRHIHACIEKLGSSKGGLTLQWGVYPPTPYENIEAVVRAMNRYAEMWV